MTAMLERTGRTTEARRVLSAVEQVQYKGNFQFGHDELGEGNLPNVVPVYMKITVPDSRHPGRIGQLRYRIYMPLDLTDREVHRTLKLAVDHAETHERNEQFLVDGVELDAAHQDGEGDTVTVWLELPDYRSIQMEFGWRLKDGKYCG